MKKKFVLAIAMILITMSVCVSLVGCVPKHPIDFMEKWYNCKSKYMESDNGISLGISGDIACSIDEKGNIFQYLQVENDNVVMYNYQSINENYFWSKQIVSVEYIKGYIDTKNEIKNTNDLINEQIKVGLNNSLFFNDFDNAYTKEEDKYVDKDIFDDSGIDSCTIKIDKNKMILQLEISGGIITNTFGFGYDKIIIPQEVLDAQEIKN